MSDWRLLNLAKESGVALTCIGKVVEYGLGHLNLQPRDNVERLFMKRD